LGVVELFQGFVEVAGQARGVEAEDGQRGSLVAHRFDDDDGGMGFGMFGTDGVGVFVEAEADQIMLERRNTVEPPRGIGEELDKLFFESADGLVVVDESADEGLVGIQVLGGQDDGLAGQAVTIGVQGRALFAGYGFGAG
jgi:hypothetical protein